MANPNPKKQTTIPLRKKNFLPLYILITCIVSFTLYYRTVSNDFLDLDDMTIVVKNYPFLKSFSNIPQAFKQGVFQVTGEKDTLASYYRPVMTLSFMADAHLSNSGSVYPKPKPFIEGNIFYHTLACVLLLLLLFELKIPPIASFLLTLVFTVHPLLNQAVAWIPGRNDSLLAVFILSSFLFLLKYIDKGKIPMLLLHGFFFLLALFTKENAIVFIPLSFFFIRFVNKKPFAIKSYILIGLVYFVCVIPWFFMRQHALITNGGGMNLSSATGNLLHNIPFIFQYITKSVLPFSLSAMSTPDDTNYFLCFVAIVIILTGIFFSKEKNKPIVVFGIVWFMLFLIPSLFSSFSGLEHRAYVPLIGVIILVSQFDWIKDASLKSKTIGNKAGVGILAIFIILFFFLSISHLHIFENRFKFDISAMETSPKSVLPCLYLAKHYEEERLYDSSIIAYREALKRDSNQPLIHTNIAGDYINMKDYDAAEDELRDDMAKHPNNAVTAFDLGLVILQANLNKPDSVAKEEDAEAVALWKKSIELDSGFVKPYNVLRQYYQATGDSGNTILYRNLYLKKHIFLKIK